MPKFELIGSASEDENNVTEKSKTSDDEYLPDLTKLRLHMYKPCVSKEYLKESCPGKESTDSEEDSSRAGNTLWCSSGKCKSKATHAESICFLGKEDILESYFEGTLSFGLETFVFSIMLVRSYLKLNCARILFPLSNF